MNSPAVFPEIFTPRLAAVELGPLVAQGRVLDAVADGSVLRGSHAEIANRLGVQPEDLIAALDELAEIGWLTLDADDLGQMAVHWTDAVVA